jgi:hypothetical protein
MHDSYRWHIGRRTGTPGQAGSDPMQKPLDDAEAAWPYGALLDEVATLDFTL